MKIVLFITYYNGKDIFEYKYGMTKWKVRKILLLLPLVLFLENQNHHSQPLSTKKEIQIN